MPNEIDHLSIEMIQPRLRDLASWDGHALKLRLEQICIVPSLEKGLFIQADSDAVAAKNFERGVLRPLVYAYNASIGAVAEFEDCQNIHTTHEDAKILADKIIDNLARMMAGVNRSDPTNQDNMVQNLMSNVRKNLNGQELLLPEFGEIIPRIEKKAAEYRAQFERTFLNAHSPSEVTPPKEENTPVEVSKKLKREIEPEPTAMANVAISQAVQKIDDITPSSEEERTIQVSTTERLTDADIVRSPSLAMQTINAVSKQLDTMKTTSFTEEFKKILSDLKTQLIPLLVKIVHFITKQEIFHHKGDLRVAGDVGPDAQVVVTDGNLTIEGNVGANTQINMKQTIRENHERAHLTIEGNVGPRVQIETNETDVTLKKEMSPDCQIHAVNGNVKIEKGFVLGGTNAGGGLRFGGKLSIKSKNTIVSSGDVVSPDPGKDNDTSPSAFKK